MSNLSLNLTAAASRLPDRRALISGSTAITYAEFLTASARMATLLERMGISPGDRVAIMLPNGTAFAIAFYGILRRGAIAVPINPLSKNREVEFYLTNTAATALFATSAAADEAATGAAAAGTSVVFVDDATIGDLIDGLPAQAAPVDRAANDTAVILHTSGTTGRPKGAELTHGGLGRNADVVARMLAVDADDVLIGCLPLFHVFGLTCGLNAAVLTGAAVALIPRFDAHAVLETITREKATVFEGVPTMYAALLAIADSFPPEAAASLRVCMSGGAALPVQVLSDFEHAFGTVILEGYGLSETSPVACFNHLGRVRKPGSIGTPIEGVEMRIVDPDGNALPVGEPGEIQIRGHNVMKGYWNLPDATAAAIDDDGWFATGDIAETDADGYFWIIDRKKDLIIRGGINVYPREIEEVLYEHPAVAEAGVIGIAHTLLGEEIGAAVALKAGMHAEPAELRDFVKDRLAAYKYPRTVWIVDALPKGPTGKILRREITAPANSGS
ncbi:long-chain-fatty-acid--CoA ligase [Nocardia sp. NPDC004582]